MTKGAVYVFNWNFICNVNMNLDAIFWLLDLYLSSTGQLCNFYPVAL